jgi:ATP-dependent protease HslVU (ClpYQ) peptidase subunit
MSLSSTGWRASVWKTTRHSARAVRAVLDARQITQRAVAAACEFDKSSAAPITCHTVNLD